MDVECGPCYGTGVDPECTCNGGPGVDPDCVCPELDCLDCGGTGLVDWLDEDDVE